VGPAAFGTRRNWMGSNLVVVQTAAGPQLDRKSTECGTEVVCDTSRGARRGIWCLVGRAAAMVRQAEHFIPSSLDFYQKT